MLIIIQIFVINADINLLNKMNPVFYLLLLIWLWIGIMYFAPSVNLSRNITTPYIIKKESSNTTDNQVAENLEFPVTIELDSTQEIEYLRDRLFCMPTN